MRPSAPSIGPASRPDSGPRAQGAALVLVIDDSVTILKVVGTILERHGYEVALARDGREGLQVIRQGNSKVDLVLLDFVMPRMNGYQFARELRADPVHKGTPIVLMSARASIIGDRFVEQTGAVDALSKPFEARALVAVVGGVLARQASSRVVMPSPESMLSDEEFDAPPLSLKLGGAGQFAALLAKALKPQLKDLKSEDLRSPDDLADRISRAIADESTLSHIGEPQVAHDEILRGNLAHISLAEVLQILQMRRQSGVMVIARGEEEITLEFADGTLALAHSHNTGVEFRLGRQFIEKGILTAEQIEDALKDRDDGTLIGEWLLTKELVTDEQLTNALRTQSAELVYEALRWQKGVFNLSTPDEADETDDSQGLGIGLSELILEGFRRVDEWRHIQGDIDFGAVIVVDPQTLAKVQDKLSKHELLVVETVDGKRTVREINEEIPLGTFDSLKALHQLLKSGVVRPN